MDYWLIWLGSMIGVLLGIGAFRLVVHSFHWPVLVGLSIGVIVFCACFLLFYFINGGGASLFHVIIMRYPTFYVQLPRFI